MTRLSIHEARSAREIAKTSLDRRVDQVREDLAARGIGGRVVDTVVEQSAQAANQAGAIARESKGIILGTAGLLALWAFRRPLIERASRLIDTIKDKIDD